MAALKGRLFSSSTISSMYASTRSSQRSTPDPKSYSTCGYSAVIRMSSHAMKLVIHQAQTRKNSAMKCGMPRMIRKPMLRRLRGPVGEVTVMDEGYAPSPNGGY
jgi:hypothetical protein